MKNNINIRRVLLAHSQLLEYPYICSGDTKHKNIEKKCFERTHKKREIERKNNKTNSSHKIYW